MFATFFGKEIVKNVTDITYIPVTGSLVVLSLIMVIRFGFTGNHAKAWICFLVFSILWFFAETAWSLLELVYHTNPFPSTADVFFVLGYPFLFCFLLYYLKPVYKAITRKMLLTTIAAAVTIMIPSVFMAYNFDPGVSPIENALGTFYPIADAIVFVPSLIGIALFFRGQVNFTWSFICIGIVLQAIGDTVFQITTFTDSYYTGHPVDIIFLWSFIFLSFGLVDHIWIFKREQAKRNI